MAKINQYRRATLTPQGALSASWISLEVTSNYTSSPLGPSHALSDDSSHRIPVPVPAGWPSARHHREWHLITRQRAAILEFRDIANLGRLSRGLTIY